MIKDAEVTFVSTFCLRFWDGSLGSFTLIMLYLQRTIELGFERILNSCNCFISQINLELLGLGLGQGSDGKNTMKLKGRSLVPFNILNDHIVKALEIKPLATYESVSLLKVILPIEPQELDLYQCLEGGQAFHWVKTYQSSWYQFALLFPCE